MKIIEKIIICNTLYILFIILTIQSYTMTSPYNVVPVNAYCAHNNGKTIQYKIQPNLFATVSCTETELHKLKSDNRTYCSNNDCSICHRFYDKYSWYLNDYEMWRATGYCSPCNFAFYNFAKPKPKIKTPVKHTSFGGTYFWHVVFMAFLAIIYYLKYVC